jgi:hypothetical protein
MDDNQRVLEKYAVLRKSLREHASTANGNDNISQERPMPVHRKKSTKSNGVDSEHSFLDLLGGCC